MAIGKLPAFQFYTGDWLKDPGVRALSPLERGIWFDMLCFMHESERRGALLLNGKPVPRPSLARMIGVSLEDLNATISTLLDLGVASQEAPAEGETEGVIFCRRMVRDEVKRQGQIEAGKLGGNPKLCEDYGRPGFVYAIRRASDGRIKIGASVNPQKRLYRLRYESQGDNLELLAAFSVKNMGTFEARLHEKYAAYASGEWFSLPLNLEGELLNTLKGNDKGEQTPSARKMNPEDEGSSSFGKNDPDAGSEIALANWLLEEAGVIADNGTRRIAADAIRLLAREGGTMQTAANFILHAARDALKNGEVVNRFWFSDQKYRPSDGKTPKQRERERQRAQFMARTEEE